MTQSTENRVISRIYGRGRGWAFSQKDFSHLGSRGAIDLALCRLARKGTIRRIIRGLYDYPKFSPLLDRQLSPDIDQAARAIARKFGWRIQPGGAAALNLMGLSSQVPGRFLYLSDGPDRSYEIDRTRLQFRHTALKEASFKLPESSILVQGLRSLGQDNITADVIAGIRQWLDPELRPKIMKDTGIATGWIYEAIRKICAEGKDG